MVEYCSSRAKDKSGTNRNLAYIHEGNVMEGEETYVVIFPDTSPLVVRHRRTPATTPARLRRRGLVALPTAPLAAARARAVRLRLRGRRRSCLMRGRLQR